MARASRVAAMKALDGISSDAKRARTSRGEDSEEHPKLMIMIGLGRHEEEDDEEEEDGANTDSR